MAYKGDKTFYDVMWRNPGKFGRKWYHVGVLVIDLEGKMSFAINANVPLQYVVKAMVDPYRAWCKVFKREPGAGEYEDDGPGPNQEPDPA